MNIDDVIDRALGRSPITSTDVLHVVALGNAFGKACDLLGSALQGGYSTNGASIELVNPHGRTVARIYHNGEWMVDFGKHEIPVVIDAVTEYGQTG